MGFKSFFESFFHRGQTKLDTTVSRSYADLSAQDIYTLLSDIKKVSQDRKSRIAEYRNMLSDGITLSAVELIAEDATQPDPERGETVWISCPENPTLENQMNSFLKNKVHMETLSFAIAFNVAAFGDCYLNTFAEDEAYKQSGNRVGDYFEIETAEFVTHLYHYGKGAGYLVEENPNSSRKMKQNISTILGEKNYIHFISDNGMNYAKISVDTIDNKTGDVSSEQYTVRYGNSFLEAARSYFKITTTIRDLLLLSRLTRSQFYRLFSVEVGASDDRETTRIIKELRDTVSTSQSIQPNTSISTQASPLSTGGNVYFPTRNGKGSVSVDTIGQDFNVSEMADVNMLNNNYYGALKIPKAFLGTTDDMPSGLGDSTLTRLDIRYARTVKRLQNVIKEGVRKLIYWKCSLDNVIPPQFTVNMYHCSSVEDDERSAMVEANISKLNSLIDALDRIDEDQKINRMSLLPFLVNSFNDKNLYNVLRDNLKFVKSNQDLLNDQEDMNQDNNNNDFDNMFGESVIHNNNNIIISDNNNNSSSNDNVNNKINNDLLKSIISNSKNNKNTINDDTYKFFNL